MNVGNIQFKFNHRFSALVDNNNDSHHDNDERSLSFINTNNVFAIFDQLDFEIGKFIVLNCRNKCYDRNFQKYCSKIRLSTCLFSLHSDDMNLK